MEYNKPKQPEKQNIESQKETNDQSMGGAPVGNNNDSTQQGPQQLVNLPKGGGAIQSIGEKFETNPVTGTFSMSVPLAISPGRGGFTPQLGLNYNSGSGNGTFGIGWGVGIPDITRKTDKGLPGYLDASSETESDTFILSGAEDLVPKNTATITQGDYTIKLYIPRTEGLFARIEQWKHVSGKIHWRTISKENITSVYGESTDACTVHPTDSNKIFSWNLERSYDAKGNVMLYKYKKEDQINVPNTVNESHRLKSGEAYTQTYLDQVKYGNLEMYKDGDDLALLNWMFTLVFDYGNYKTFNTTGHNVLPASKWDGRQDAFSNYKAGFEIRTYRLCERVLMFHTFSELGADAVLVKSTELEYQKNPYLTLLQKVTHKSYEGATSAELPPMSFTYSKAEIGKQLNEVAPNQLENLPAGVDGSTWQFTDLYGEGLNGILRTENDAWYYKHNLGDKAVYEEVVTDTKPDLQLSPMKVLKEKPTVVKGQGTSFYLGDVDSDSQPEAIFYGPGTQGYFTLEDGEWQNFQTFKQMPNVDMNDSNVKMIDLSGDGLADILISRGKYFELYFSAGKEGYKDYRRIASADTEDQGPIILFSDAKQSIFLADMAGDGLTDIVKITSNSVCYWPNKGYGYFGDKVYMKNTPLFDSLDTFSPARIKLADVDGTGTTDIIYLSAKGVNYYKNQSGNGWSNAETIAAFPLTDNMSQVHVTDLLGNGTSCLVWSSPLPAHEHNLKFVELTSGIKPYMLTQFENNMGRKVSLKYAPSTQFFLQDKAAGKPWITRLPFPVQVLEQVEDYEQVSDLRFINRYAYHHGYYDTAEREFCGFGMVEQWDTEITPTQDAPPGGGIKGGDLEGYQPPVYTKKWFHTGFFKNREEISLQYANEYFKGDNEAWLLPDTKLPEGLTPEETREACRALRGQILRSEVYAQDGSIKEEIPYLVEEKSFALEMLQAKADNKHAVFMLNDGETISYHYERNTNDPRILHALTLETDTYGNILKSAQAAYPRRISSGAEPEQLSLKIIVSENDVINKTEANVNLLGIAYQAKSYELTGVSFSDKKFEINDLKTAFASATEIDYSAKPNSGLEKRCFQHQRTYFYDQDLTGALELGQIADHALPYNSLTADVTDDLLTDLTASQAGITSARLTSEAKYTYEDGKYWIPSEIATHDASKFYLPIQNTDPFENSTQIVYDNYNLFITKVTDALGFETIAEHDYRVMHPKKITDPNKNSQEVGFDTLGMVIKLALKGSDGEGDTLASPSIEYDYDLSTWQTQQKPVYAYIRTREKHADDTTNWLKSYVYSGGLGNEVMTKVQAEDGDVNGTPCTNRWVGTGRTILNNKGNVIKQYEPYFSDNKDFEAEVEITQNGVSPIFYYDPIGRNIKIDFPDGTLSKVEFTPWQQKNYDQNDTVLESQWYADLGSPDPLAAEPVEAKQRAAWLTAKHANTPQVRHFDNLGQEFKIDDDNGSDGIYTIHNKLDIAGRPTVVTDAKGRAMTQLTMGMQQVFITQNIDSGTRWLLADIAGKPVYSWDSRNHQIQNTYDQLQRPILVLLSDLSVSVVKEIVVEKTVYGTDPNKNNIGQIAKQYDQSGLTEFSSYDFKGNPLQTVKKFADEYKNYISWDQPATCNLELETKYEYDALNRPTHKTLPNSTVETYTYNKAGLLETVTNDGQAYVNNINYNEKGQRTDIYYGNNSKTKYEYDESTFRLNRLLTTRNNGADILQDLNYTYDPVGNITEQIDNAQQTHYFNNAVIEPKGQYTYDALYRLIKATGRELESLQMPTHEDFTNNIPNPNVASNAMQNYTQQYIYDELGNMQQVKSIGQWTRDYYYNFANNNYLLGHTDGTTGYTYDAHGNMLTMPHLQALNWDYKDQLLNVELDVSGNKAYYIYDAGGNRTRKVIEKGNVIEERFYLGDYELYRKTTSGTVDFERKTVHISDDKKKIALIETKTGEQEVTRYQYDNHLGSASLELDENAEIISYEEYHPFGTTSYRSGRTETETSQKRYKYVGKERDEETGLYYYGARYYAAWICRFVNVDPLQFEYPELTSFQYASNRPITGIDLDGLEFFNPNEPQSPKYGVKLNYSKGGGLSLGLFRGFSTKVQNGKGFGAMAGVNISANVNFKGLGTAQNNFLFTLVGTPSLTLGYGQAKDLELNLFTAQSGSGVSDPFQYSYSYGHNYILSSGTNSDGSGRSQINAAFGFRIGSFAASSYNDTRKAPFFSPVESDQFYSAGVKASLGYGDFSLNYSFDLYYGMSEQDATYDDDRIIDGQNYDNQALYDMLFNKGIERITINNSLGVVQMGSRTGYKSFWPSNKMHDSQEQEEESLFAPSIPSFHHLFVPYENGSYKPSSLRINSYLKGQTFNIDYER